jgi:hypothetical protein
MISSRVTVNHLTCFLFFVFFPLFFPVSSQAQSNPVSKNTLYADFASKDVYYSINYDRVFHSGEKLNWSYRIGASILKNAFAVPLGLQVFTAGNKSHAEFSLTLIPYVDHSSSFLNTTDKSDKYIYVEPGIGYRYQERNGGLFFKAVFTPIIFLDPPSDDFWNMDPKFYAGGNVSLGFTFPSRKKN